MSPSSPSKSQYPLPFALALLNCSKYKFSHSFELLQVPRSDNSFISLFHTHTSFLPSREFSKSQVDSRFQNCSETKLLTPSPTSAQLSCLVSVLQVHYRGENSNLFTLFLLLEVLPLIHWYSVGRNGEK